ncbi:hypothetical protein ACP70R_026776 [Stipagrostis hirtigluma subsp. patula]
MASAGRVITSQSESRVASMFESPGALSERRPCPVRVYDRPPYPCYIGQCGSSSMEKSYPFPSISSMADGNQSAKGKAVAVEPDCPVAGGGSGSAAPPNLGHGHQGRDSRSNGGGWGGTGPSNPQHVGYAYCHGNGSSAAGGGGGSGGVGSSNLHNGYAGNGTCWNGIGGGSAVDRYAAGTSGGGGGNYGGNGGGASYGDPHGNGGRGGGGIAGVDWIAPGGYGSGSAPSPSPRIGAGMYAPQQHALPTDIWRHTAAAAGGGSAAGQHYEFLHGNGSATFPSPLAGPAGMYAPRHALADPMYPTNAVPLPLPLPPFVPVPDGGRPRSPPQRWYDREHMDDLVAEHLRALTIGGRSNSPPGRGHRRVNEFLQHQQARPLRNAGGANGFWPGRGHAVVDPYGTMRLEDVRGRMRRIAWDLPAGCQFLARMVAEGGAAAAQQVFDEVGDDVVRLMGDPVGHALVEELAKFWTTDEQITRVLRILGAASSGQIVAAASNQAGSNILQSLITRIAGQPGHVESFTRALAGGGDSSVLSLIEDMSGSQLILKCLEMFSAEQNQFITDAVLRFPHRVCRDRHGCHVMNRCIDTAGDERTRDSLVLAVCGDALALAEHGYGNYVVQHIIEFVPGANDMLHQAFLGQYVILSRQKASSHVVQRCLQFFSREQVDEIVAELLQCHLYGAFYELMSDPYANYVLQTAMERTQGQMQMRLLGAIGAYRNALRGDSIAKMVLQKLFTLMRSYR